jgi:uncharacterized membrane protein YraQ (UPF0718 family)
MTSETLALRFQELPIALRRLASDRVVAALGLGLLLLALVDVSQVGPSLVFTGASLLTMAPFLLLAVAFAAFAKASGADQVIARAFSGSPVVAVMGAALMGALSPFCSCGVIPLIAAMLGAGVPLAPVMAFWIASPIMDPEMFVLTAAGIGLGFSVAKTLAAVAMGLVSGFAVLGLQRLGRLRDPLRVSSGCGSCRPGFDTDTPVAVTWRFWREPARRRSFQDEGQRIGWFLGKWLTFAFFLESLMMAYVPTAWIAEAVGDGNAFAIPLATVVGIPSYLNGYAAIPLVAGLMDMGMAPGAAMAFVTAGAVSSIPAAIAVFALVKKPVFFLYLGLGLAGALLAGYAYQLGLTVTL